MPIKITIRLMSGETLEYFARSYQGRARFRTHQPRMEEMVLKHLGLGSHSWRVKLIHEDDHERMTAIYRDYIQRHIEENQQPRNLWKVVIPSEEKQQEEIANLDEGYRSVYRNLIEEQRYYTENTVVHAFVEEINWEKLEKLMIDMDSCFEENQEMDE